MWDRISFLEAICLTLAGAGCLALARWVLLPVHRRAREHGRTAKGRWRPVQFRMGDLLFLVFYLSLGLGLLVAANRLFFQALPREDVSFWELQLFGCVLLMFGGLWWLGIRLLSRADIRNRWRRVVLFVSLPLIYVSSFVFALGVSSVWLAILFGHGAFLHLETFCICIAPPFLVSFFGLCRVINWVASPEKPPGNVTTLHTNEDSQNHESALSVDRQHDHPRLF